MNSALRERILEKARQFNRLEFIEDDPICIPHRFSKKEDIEISALLTALMSWGRRDIIIRNAANLMERMDHSPHAFVLHATEKELDKLQSFIHRTLNGRDLLTLVKGLRGIYQGDGLEEAFAVREGESDTQAGIVRFRQLMLQTLHEKRFRKHLADPDAGSAAKRIHMFLRWMVRKDAGEVDLGIWRRIPMHKLMIPLDVHSGRIARELGMLKRKQNDRRAVEELTASARQIIPEDPALVDYALFGMGLESLALSKR